MTSISTKVNFKNKVNFSIILATAMKIEYYNTDTHFVYAIYTMVLALAMPI